MREDSAPFKVLFVCLGNICRSPSAEVIFAKLIEKRGLHPFLQCDSAGTSSNHVGEQADPRTRKHAEQRGYKITHRARALTTQDFANFDLLLGMDEGNLQAMRRFDPSGQYAHKVKLLTDYSSGKYALVPDPYYLQAAAFEEVLDICEWACTNLIETLLQEQSLA